MGQCDAARVENAADGIVEELSAAIAVDVLRRDAMLVGKLC